MKGNNLRTLDAGQLPLDRLQKLYLSDNPFECNCSLLWLWRLTNGIYDAVDDNNNENTNTNNNNNMTNSLVLDKIGCDVALKETVVRRILNGMPENEIKCPAHIVTVISVVISVLLVIIIGISILLYFRMMKKKKKKLSERKNVNEHVVPQQVDKLELERYLAAQEMSNEYRALRPWELPVKELIEESDHYENFDDFMFDSRRLNNKPHVVYV